MDPNDLNSLSEVESLSDSDWLDISSRASEDNDSLAESDTSDREDLASDYRPPSRRSLDSHASSHEGDVQGWEGIIEDSADETPAFPAHFDPDAATGTDAAILCLSRQSLSFRTVALSEAAVAQLTALADPEEEQRVKDALDQSMVSTLSASRSNSLNASVQNSVVHSRDLRLSFPDPLTSSSPHVHSLSPSYEDITTDMAASNGDTQDPTKTVAEGGMQQVHTMTPTAADPGTDITPVVAQDGVGARTIIPARSVVDFSIVLYGTSSGNKHRVVQRVLEKLMAATQCGFSSLPQIDVPQNIRMLLNGGRPSHSIISIVDRTGTGTVLFAKEPGSVVLSDRPSLAIVFLPSSIISLPEHTLYLPVLIQEDLEYDDEDVFTPCDRYLDAEHQWDTMGVPKSRLVSSAFTLSNSTVIEEEEIERASPAKVARAFRPIFPCAEQSGYHLASRHALTLFAILSIVLGYLVNGSLPVPALQRATPTMDVIPHPAPTPVANASVPQPAPVSTPSPSGVALMPSSMKDFALAAVSPYVVASTSSVATKAIPSPTAASTQSAQAKVRVPSECSCGCGLITWPEKLKPMTDLILRPTAATPSLASQPYHKGNALTIVPPPTSVKGKGKAREVEDESLYALSTRLVGALSEYLDMATMFVQVRKEFQEIFDALDDLARAITIQTDSLWAQSRSTLEVVQKSIRTRHARARTRAKELKAAGERLLTTMTSCVRERVSVAKENARTLRENVRVRREDSFRVRQEKRGRERRVERRMRRAQSAG